MSQEPTRIEISWRTIVFTVLFLLGLKLLWIVRGLLVSLFIAFMVMSVVKPLTSRLERYRIPRSLSTLLIFIILIFLVGSAFFLILPSLIYDATSLVKTVPDLITYLPPQVQEYINVEAFYRNIPNLTNQAFSILSGIFSNLVFVITTLFFSFYFIVDEDFVKHFLVRFFPESKAQRVAEIFDRTEKRMSAWFWGELVLMTVIGLLTFVGLSVIGVRHALSLAVLAGLLEIVPIIGPIISAIPAIIFSLNQSSFLGISTAALYLIVQQLENNLIVPTVMKRAVGLNKILILIVLIMGGKLGGFAGIFLAIPVTLFLETVITEVTHFKKS